MNNFWCHISSSKYSVGCTGGTVFLYDNYGNRLAKFKDVPYGYTAMFSPDGKIFVVKTTEGRLAVYSPENRCLIKKFRFSNVDSSQDDGFCFSADSKLFYNVERQKNELNHCISVYDTDNFSLVNRFLEEDNYSVPRFIEYTDKEIFVLGFTRSNRFIFDKGFVAKLKDGVLTDMYYITEAEYDFYSSFKTLELSGFSEKASEWSDIKNIDKTELIPKPLCELWNLKAL